MMNIKSCAVFFSMDDLLYVVYSTCIVFLYRFLLPGFMYRLLGSFLQTWI